jgi:hypothetical protein
VLSPVVSGVLATGITGILLIALAWLFYRGWRLIPPDREAAGREAARAEARADLLEERARVLAEKTKIEGERDEALKFTQSNLVPLLLNFTNATSALIPLLQELVRYREGGSDIGSRRHR